MNLFAYGTLMDQDVMRLVSGGRFRFRPALLNNYVRKQIRGEIYPAITRANDRSVAGTLYFAVSSAALARLDRFEGRQYVRRDVAVICDHGKQCCAQAYVIAAEFANQLLDSDWNYSEFLKTGKQMYLGSDSGYEGSHEFEEF